MNCGKHNVIGAEKFQGFHCVSREATKACWPCIFSRFSALVKPLCKLTMAQTRYWKQTRFERIYRKGTEGGTRGPR
jgi:hypothetical protein